ncbi:unnamed protein product [Allacma fusca]|uniref:Folate receptor-like domain-containing protein n=1 Tax=Allacma fusca TaxID=39272 RepID=A0A8J2LRK7_9HEXA|nr:unnamed protein product [Allacma fusca]
MLSLCVLFVLFSASASFRPDVTIDSHELFDRCLDGENHKRKPGPEDALHGHCSPWVNRSCCTEDTAQLIHHGVLYNFDWDHCKNVKNMSDECRKHFNWDHCFFECSPNVGPWLVKIPDMKTRNESYFEVPLCANECDSWFEACKNDYTCTDNWLKNFEWKKVGRNKKRTNVCPAESTCKTFKEIYQTADNFCERVWDHSWKYTSNDQPCMKMWFDGPENPNDDVARWKIQVMYDDDTTSPNNSQVQLLGQYCKTNF